ncbi:MAG: hypothetical protein LQ350_004574 [Teloschistes chrysophthalmus]|nr:MAG: hypothetical protein LQ350_004574 [Niorma chrysophthalma]
MPPPPKILSGTVISAGLMEKAVKVRTTKPVYDSFLRKHYTRPKIHHVSDPNSSLRTGDVVRIAAITPRGVNGGIRHVVTNILAPWGPPIEERPPIPTFDQIAEKVFTKIHAKSERRLARKAEARIAGDRKSKGKHTDLVGGLGPEVVDAEAIVEEKANQ